LPIVDLLDEELKPNAIVITLKPFKSRKFSIISEDTILMSWGTTQVQVLQKSVL